MPEPLGLFPTERETAPEGARSRAEPRRLYADVAIDRPMRCEYTYGVPDELCASVAPGVRVVVPFARRRAVAVVVGVSETTDLEPARIKDVGAVLESEPVVDAELLELTRWIASYYACSWGEALAAVLPAALKRERSPRLTTVVSAAPGVGPEQLATLEQRNPKQHRLLRTLLELDGPIGRVDLLRRLNLSDSPLKTLAKKGWLELRRVEAAPDVLTVAGSGEERPRPAALMPEQVAAVEAITAPLHAGEYACVLLQGVTGSGKTEVYLHAIEEALALGRGAIVLVPEIALTPQTVGWFRSRFGAVAVLHSRMTDVQRLDMWMRVKQGELRVVVGARSAVFAPVRDLGVIVVDEEHEPSFKQSSAPRYHARDVAVMRARKSGAVCVLGSATPSLESWRNARIGRYRLVEMKRRAAGGRLPEVRIIDMRHEQAGEKGPAFFSRHLLGLLEGALERKEQAILFLNRRGFSTTLWCRACGATIKCGQCDVALTWHRRIARIVCHSCYEERVPPKSCPDCSAPGLRFIGAGSERVEDAFRNHLPDARVARMDSDTMLRREDYESTLAAFGRGDLDVLVGTQMIAKGLDFPRVTVVGIVSADTSLHLPDFRSAERTFQLISQVAGRAGRSELPGNIVIQTRTPEHPAIVHAAQHDFERFASGEAQMRRELGYPPYGRVVRVVIDDEQEARVAEAAQRFALALEEAAGKDVTILGPAPAPIALLRGRHRRHILIKAAEGAALDRVREVLVRLAAERSRPRVAIDVDPVAML